MNECIVRKNIENKQKEWLMPPNLISEPAFLSFIGQPSPISTPHWMPEKST
jgi:hypothetical protein